MHGHNVAADDDEPVGGAYTGDSKQGMRHGLGKYVYNNAFFSYAGSWHKGMKHGQGTLAMGDGSQYEGEFVLGEIQGWGTRTWPSGATYSGQFYMGEMHGKGTRIDPDGSQYEGQHAENKRHGAGKLLTADGSIYEGEFEFNKKMGKGSMTYPDGTTYDGDWSDNEKHGHGVQKWPDASVYTGQWEGSQFHGEGTYEIETDTDERRAYMGQWCRGQACEIPTAMHVESVVVAKDEEASAIDEPEASEVTQQMLPPSPKRTRAKNERQAFRRGAPAELKARRVTIIMGQPMPVITLAFLDEHNQPVECESGRQVEMILKRFAVPEATPPPVEKKGGKKGARAEPAAAPACQPELLEEISMGKSLSVQGRVVFAIDAVPNSLKATTADKECELHFVDVTAEKHPLFFPPDTLEGTHCACEVVDTPVPG